MFKKTNRKGFTLIEMLVVIAIIAVLVAIIIPTVTAATGKAQAATDAANLRSVLGALNSEIMVNNTADTVQDTINAMDATDSKLHPDAKLYVLYTTPGIIDVYYVDGTNYYGLKYLSDYAQNGSSSISTVEPTIESGDEWFEVTHND